MITKRDGRKAIIKGEYPEVNGKTPAKDKVFSLGALGTGWIVSEEQSIDNNDDIRYIDLFENAYDEVNCIKKVAITLALDRRPLGRIRIYVYFIFVDEYPSENWRSDYEKCTEHIETFEIVTKIAREDGEAGGMAFQLALDKKQSWEKWDGNDLKRHKEELRDCCTKLATWTDAYVKTLK